MTKFIVLIVVVMLLPAFACADNGERVKSAEVLVDLLRIEQNIADSIAQYKGMMTGIIAATDTTSADSEAAKKQQKKFDDLISSELNWNKIKPDFVKLYSDTFTIDELNEMVKFYKSKPGKTLVEKTPELTKKTMEMFLVYTSKLFPQLVELSEKASDGNNASDVDKQAASNDSLEKELSKYTVIAEAGDVKITVADYLKEKGTLPENLMELTESVEGRHELLESMLHREMIYKEALIEKVNTDEAVKEKMDELFKRVVVEVYLGKHVNGLDETVREQEFINLKNRIKSKYNFKYYTKLR